MPNLTPVRYRHLYEIYPDKACIRETAGQCHTCTEARIRGLGRTPGKGRGDVRSALDGEKVADVNKNLETGSAAALAAEKADFGELPLLGDRVELRIPHPPSS